MRARDDVHRHELADARGRGGAGVGRRLHGRDVAAHDGRDVAGADLLPADQRDLGGLDHGVGRLDHGDQALGFDHSQRLSHSPSPISSQRPASQLPRSSNAATPSSWELEVGSPANYQSLRCLTASAIRAVSSPYVSRISPSLLAWRSASVTSGTSRSVDDAGASSTWQSA